MAMLHAVWQKISGRPFRSEPMASEDDDDTMVEPSFSAIDDFDAPPLSLPDKYLPLWRLQSQRQIIEVKDENNRSYQTMVIAIDIQRGIVWLDDLFPNQHMLEIGDELTLHHHRNGKQLSFSSPIVAWGKRYGAGGVAIMLPEETTYQSRRQSSRLDLTHKASIVVKVIPAGFDASYGTLQDLSTGGLRLKVSGNLVSQLRHGALVPVCEFKLDNDVQICCSARIRAFHSQKTPLLCTYISIEFIDLSIEKQKQIKKFLGDVLLYNEMKQQLALPELAKRSA